MKLLSLFDGSGAFCLAAEHLGIQARYASEIEPFPIAVTRARFPRTKPIRTGHFCTCGYCYPSVKMVICRYKNNRG